MTHVDMKLQKEHANLTTDIRLVYILQTVYTDIMKLNFGLQLILWITINSFDHSTKAVKHYSC